MTKIEEGQIQIHTENIFPIIKKAVYSDHEIFVRELVSNGVDAISKRRMAAIANDCEDSDGGKIHIKIDKEAKSLTITDNGIGMTSSEIKKYINQVAFSSAEEFLEKYKQSEEGIIGHFGLGFYSSFMVSSKVQIISKSAIKDSSAIKWTCDGSPNFKLEETNKDEIGTDVILYLMEDELEYLEPSRIKTLIKKYCDFMPVDVQLAGESINKQDPPWRKSAQNMTDKDYIDLYNYLYPFQGEPLLWVHLNTDYPYNLQGILYFPKLTGRADLDSGEIKLYCNQVFVSDSIKEIVPRYLLPLRGIIDSTDIPLNVSRSALQSNRKVKSIGNFISRKISDKLKSLKEQDSSSYAEIWESIAPFIKIGAIEEEKFAEQIQDVILFRTTRGKDFTEDEEIIYSNNKCYTTINSYLNRVSDTDSKKVIYCTDEVSQGNALNLWKGLGNEIIFADTVIDSQFIPWVESKNENTTFLRVDSEIDDESKDDSIELKDKDGSSKSDSLKQLIDESLNNPNVTVKIQGLKGNSDVPAIILLPEQLRRINDMGALMEQKLPGLPKDHVLLINKNHPLVDGLTKLNSTSKIIGSEKSSANSLLAKDISILLYEMACLSLGGMEAKSIAEFQKRSSNLMGQLISKIV